MQVIEASIRGQRYRLLIKCMEKKKNMWTVNFTMSPATPVFYNSFCLLVWHIIWRAWDHAWTIKVGLMQTVDVCSMLLSYQMFLVSLFRK